VFHRDQFSVPEYSSNNAEDASDIFAFHGLRYHLFADDMQGYCSGRSGDVQLHAMASRIERCVSDVSDWCAAKRLQLNADKTEVLWFDPPSQLRQLSSVSSAITINRNIIKPSSVVRDLGVLFDAELSMRQHVSLVSQTCFFHLRRIRSVRRQLGRDVTAKLVTALVLSRLDHCNAVLAGLPATTLAPLQRVLHAAARTVLDLKLGDHVTPALRELHWLPITERIQYKPVPD